MRSHLRVKMTLVYLRYVEFLQPIADRPGAVGEKLLPARIERLEIKPSDRPP